MQNLKSLIKWLEDNERSQSWLADKLEVNRTTICNWLNGVLSISHKQLPKIEEVTGIVPTKIDKTYKEGK